MLADGHAEVAVEGLEDEVDGRGILALNYGWSSFTAARELDTSGITAER